MAIVSAAAQLVAAFNAKNPTLPQALAVGDVTFTTPAEHAPGGGDNRNTEVTLTALAESTHFEGSVVLHYIRLAAGVVGAKAVTDDQADWDTDEEVLAFLNADVIAAGKTEDAFAAPELTFVRTDGEDGEKIITVSIKEDHLKYLPGVIATYTVTQEIQKTDLSTTDGELDGF